MSYSSYNTLQDVLERIKRVELTLALLVRTSVTPSMDIPTRDVLLSFADFIESEHARASLAPGKNS